MTDGAAQLVRSHYEALGELYRAAWGDSLHFAFFKPGEDREQAVAAMERMLMSEVDLRPGISVLDVGCGTGDPALAIGSSSGAHVTGIDLVRRHVERARVRASEQGLGDRTRFLEGDATSMPFPAASFDHVYAVESAYHAADKARFYGECARVLRPGGCFFGTDWLRGEHASGDDHDQILARMGEYFAIPNLIDLPTLRAHLTASGLIPEVVEDLSRLGDVQRNWDALDESAWPRLARAARRHRRTPCAPSSRARGRSPRPPHPGRSSSGTGGREAPSSRVPRRTAPRAIRAPPRPPGSASGPVSARTRRG